MLEKTDYIYGIRAVIEAIESGKEIDKVLVRKDLKGDLARELMEVVKYVMNAIHHALNVKEIQKLAQIAKMVYIRNLCVDII